MIEELILRALQTAAIAAYNSSSISALTGWTAATRIKAIARTLTPPTDARYIEFVNIPNNRGGDYWDKERVYQGNFRILLHWNIDDQGAYKPLQYIDEIGAYFTKQKQFPVGDVFLQIYDVPSGSGPVLGGSELLFPLTLPYRCFRP